MVAFLIQNPGLVLKFRCAMVSMACGAPVLAAAEGLRVEQAAAATAAQSPWQWQGSAGVLSDKVVYGISQSGGRASAVLDFSARSSTGWIAAAGLATLPAERGSAELSLAGGRSGAVGELGAWQASITGYATTGAGPLRRPAYLQAGLGYAWNERLQLGLWVAPRQPGPAPGGGRTRGRVAVLEASWHQPLVHGLALELGAGHVAYSGLAVSSYDYGSVGLSWGRGPWQVFLTRVASSSASPAAAGPRALASVLLNF